MQRENCLCDFAPTRSDARFCGVRCRVAAFRARQRAADRAEAFANYNPAPAADAEKVALLESLVLALVKEHDPKLYSEVADRAPEHRIVFVINRLVADGLFELPRSMTWPVRRKRAGVLARLARLAAVPLWRAGFEGAPA